MLKWWRLVISLILIFGCQLLGADRLGERVVAGERDENGRKRVQELLG